MCITSCMFIYVRPIPEEGQPELPREGFGYISRQVGILEPPSYRECVFYSPDEKDEYFDSMWKAGKAMSLLATGVGFIVMMVIMCTCCVAFRLPTFDGLSWTCMLCFIAQCFTFLAWGSDMCDEYECTWASGTGMNITAAMLWVWAANMIKSFPEALPPRGRGRRKAPQYEDDSDMGDDESSPYLQPSSRGFQDEYDESEDSMVDFQDEHNYNNEDDGTYGDGAYDDGTYGDGYDEDQSYPTQDDGYEDDGNNEYTDPYYDAQQQGENPYDQYEENDYEDPSISQEKGRRGDEDNNFEPNQGFQESWNDGSAVDDEEFNATDEDGNFFQQDDLSGSHELSQEEMEFLGRRNN
jgi:hypothetical protein